MTANASAGAGKAVDGLAKGSPDGVGDHRPKTAVSIIAWAVGVMVTFALFVVMLLMTVITFPFDKKRKLVHAQCFWWCDILTNFNPFWNVTVSGLEHIDYRETYVAVANHQSLADIILLYKTRMQFKWVAKESLFSVPIIGWCLRLAKHISLKREDYSSIKRIYREAAGWLRQDISVFFFPEGTRSTTADMNAFQNGAFKLALKEQRPILPILLVGTREAIPRGSWRFSSKVDCRVKVLKPIPTAGLGVKDFELLKSRTLEAFASAGAS